MKPAKLYPNLEAEDSHTFRLSHIKDIKAFFEKDIEDRRKTINKYKKAYSGLTWTSNACVAVGVACEASSIALFATGIGAIAGLALEGIGLGIGLLAIPVAVSSRKLLKKLEKHEEIHILAIAKLNSVNDLIAKALEDGQVDDKEYKTIINEHEKYIELKNAIRKKALAHDSSIKVDELKKEFLEKGREMGKKEIMERLLKSEP
jgi:hypothetical protein